MDWTAFRLSLHLGGMTVLILMPLAVLCGRWLALSRFRGKSLVEAVLALPLVLPPTVAGYYLLVLFNPQAPGGTAWHALSGRGLAFTFDGLVLASLIINIPFAVQPVIRAFEAVGPELREAAAACGLSWWRTLWRIELPLVWPGLLTGLVLTFAHTLGEFGVVLMVGGNIPGETRTLAITIYDRVQAFDDAAAGAMAAFLLTVSLAAIALSYILTARVGQRHG